MANINKGCWLALVWIILLPLGASTHAAGPTVAGAKIVVAESRDYSSAVLGAPWDMSDYDDVSRYLNESGQRDNVRSVNLYDGVFSGVSSKNVANGVTANFYPLFPGYAAPGGKRHIMPKGETIGFNYPIKTADFGCLYIAMKVDSPVANSFGPDQFLVFWWSNYLQNTYSAAWDSTFEVLYPEAGASKPAHGWRLYRVNLRRPARGLRFNSAPWDSRSEWQGLRIDPTINQNVGFEVDWVRLTGCSAQTVSVDVPTGATAIYLRPTGTTRNIRVASGLTSGTHSLDVQGVAPGTYDIAYGTATSCCAQTDADQLVVNQAPQARFLSPSYTSGSEYSRGAGNAWDFSDAADASVINATSRYSNGALEVTTPSGPLPAGVDSQVFLNTPVAIDPAIFRYLTFRLRTEWTSWPYGTFQWQNVTQGMIARLIWTRPSVSNTQGALCDQVSKDIPLNVGWQTYTIDLHDSFDGVALDQYPPGGPHCPAAPGSWQSAGSVLRLRFDPNENISCNPDSPPEPVVPCSDFRQWLDWIRLNAEDSIAAGTAYPISIGLNKPSSSMRLTYYYTTDRANPTQHQVRGVTPPGPQPVAGQYSVLLPALANGQSRSEIETVPYPASMMWDTQGVSANRYYICVRMDDGLNSETQCSDVPVIVR